MATIIISNENIILENYCDKDEIILDTDLIKYLSANVKFSSDLIFERFFNLILLHKKEFEIIFHNSLGGYSLTSFEEDFNKETDDVADFDTVVSWVSDYNEADKDNESELLLYPSLGGYDSIKSEFYGLSFSSLSKLKKTKFKLDESIDIQILKKRKGLVSIFKADIKEFKLFDAIHAVLEEISFFGDPKSREEVGKELEKRCDEIDDAIKDGTIDEKTFTMEEVELEIAERFLKFAVKDEDYEEAENQKKEIKRLTRIVKKQKPNKYDK